MGSSRKEGIPPQPTLQCHPNPLALPARPCWSQGAPSQSMSVPHRTPFSAPLLKRASPTRREAQQTGSEHRVGFIRGISRQQCCCLGTLTQPHALPSSCVWGATQPLTKSQQRGKGGGRNLKGPKYNPKGSCPVLSWYLVLLAVILSFYILIFQQPLPPGNGQRMGRARCSHPAPFNKHFQVTQAASIANGKLTALEKSVLISLNPHSRVTKRAPQPCLPRDAASISPALLFWQSPQAIPVPSPAIQCSQLLAIPAWWPVTSGGAR